MTIWCFYDVAGKHWVKLKKYQQSLKDREQVVIAQTARHQTKIHFGIFFLIQPVTLLDITGLPQSSRELISNPVYNFGLGRKQECESQDYAKVESKAVRKQPE